MPTCLLIDDSEVVRKVARYIFESLKFDTIEAERGEDGLAHCAKAMPDAILLDSHIPAMPTAAFLSALRAMPNGDKPIVIYCTTENDPAEIARALTGGADDYVLKPFDRESIAKKMSATGLIPA
jgi:two-component system chemotaxis response regulator CheY